MVLDFHGFTMTAEEQRQYSKWDVLAEEEGFIAVFPEGVPDSPSELRNAKTPYLRRNLNKHSGPGTSMTTLVFTGMFVIETGNPGGSRLGDNVNNKMKYFGLRQFD